MTARLLICKDFEWNCRWLLNTRLCRKVDLD